MKYSRLLQLVRPDSGFSRALQTYDGVDLTIEIFDSFNDTGASYRLEFRRTISFSGTDELTSAGFLPDSYDALIEVHNSQDHRDIIEKTQHLALKDIREFRLFIEGFGALTIFSVEVSW